MKLLKLTSAYPAYLDDFARRHPGYDSGSYAEQSAALALDAFAWADFWSKALTPLGYETWEVTANAVSLQTAWARENGFTIPESNETLATTFAQACHFKPDVLFLDDYSTFTYEWIQELRQACPSIKLVLGWCGAPYNDGRVFKAYDRVLSCIPELVEKFKSEGHHSHHFNHAFEPSLLERLGDTGDKDIPFSFVGNIVRTNRYHLTREQMLEQLIDVVPLAIYSPSYSYGLKDDLEADAKWLLYHSVSIMKGLGIPAKVLGRVPVVRRAAAWTSAPLRPVNPKLKRSMRPGVFGLNMYRTLLRSKATFNSHIDVSSDSASNARLFEATGVGTCLVTDDKANMAALFEPDREVVTYKTAEECAEKVKWLLEHPVQCEAIARAAQSRVLKEHTFAHRAVQLDTLIQRALRSSSTPQQKEGPHD